MRICLEAYILPTVGCALLVGVLQVRLSKGGGASQTVVAGLSFFPLFLARLTREVIGDIFFFICGSLFSVP